MRPHGFVAALLCLSPPIASAAHELTQETPPSTPSEPTPEYLLHPRLPPRHARPAEEPDDSFETKVVTKRVRSLQLSKDDFPGQVDIITPEDIKKSGARTVAEVLEHLAGVSINDEQGNSQQKDVTLRGERISSVTGLSQGISIYIDNVRVNEIDADEVNFDLLPLTDVEQIEVIRGPHALFGRNTLGGSINFVTRRGGKGRHTSVDAALGSFLDERLRVRTEGTLNGAGYYLAVNLGGQQGWRDGSHEQTVQAFSAWNYALSERTTLSFTGLFNNNLIYQAGSLPPNAMAARRRGNMSPGDFYKPTMYMGTLQLEHQFTSSIGMIARVFVRQNTLSELNVNALTTNTGLTSDMLYTGAAVRFFNNMDWVTVNNKFIAGLEGSIGDAYLVTNAYQNQTSLAQCTDTSAANCPLATIQDQIDDRQRMAAVYIQDTLQFTFAGWSQKDTFTISGAVRSDVNTHNVNDTSPDTPGAANGKATYKKIIPSLGVRWESYVDIYARFSQGFRAPSFLELICASSEAPCIGLEAGVAPDTSFTALNPVSATNYEIGFEIDVLPNIIGHVAIYQTDLTNDIFSVTPNGTSDLYFANVGNTRRRGLEASANWNSTDWNLHIDYTYTLATFESAIGTLETPRTGGDETIAPGNQLSLMPNHRAQGSARYQIVEGLFVSANLLYVGSQYFRGDEENTQPKLPGYARVDIAANYQDGAFEAFLQVQNVINSNYSTFATYAPNPTLPATPIQPFYTPALPTNVMAGASYTF